ncbi:hypothetical protein PVAG01_07808 [Phlyctema vagabunda]|uniref:SET domain-containing protein n=1 Tax=Phlyctema vagabunda TaxID=108571 RepID=A0ABR4PDG9_9HELO
MAIGADVWPLGNSYEDWMSSVASWRSWQQSKSRAASQACAAPVTGAEGTIKDLLSVEPISAQLTSLPTPAAIFTTEYFEVIPSPKGGYGCFALKTIKKDTRIFSEMPLVEATDADFLGRYQSLPEPTQKEFMSLAGWEMLADNKVEAIWKNNRYLWMGILCSTVVLMTLYRFRISGGSAVFAKSSRFNHACIPLNTCTYQFNHSTREMVFTTLKEVKPGQELTISYCCSPASLYDDYGFFCDCEGCPKYSEGEKMQRVQQRKRDFDRYLNAKW